MPGPGNKINLKQYWLHLIVIAGSLAAFALGGRNLYILILIMIGAFVILLKRIRAQEVFLLVLMIALFYLPLFGTFDKLREIHKEFAGSFDEVIPAVFTPDSGLDMLPKRVWAGGELLKQNNVDRFRISKILAEDWEIYQRTVEGLWPKQLDPQSPYWVITEHELPAYIQCEILGSLEAIMLVRCD